MNRDRYQSLLCLASACACVIGVPREAHANVQDCVDAHSNGQLRRDESDFLAAHALFASCMDETCPEPIRVECTAFLDKLDALTPTVLLEARDARGADVLDVVVRVDDQPYLNSLTGRATPINPGSHKFQFVKSDGTMSETRVLILEGVKRREIIAHFGETAITPARQPVADVAPHDVGTKSETKNAGRTLAYVLAGGGVAALASFGYFALSGRSRQRDLERSCSPNCTDSQVRAVSDRYLVADLSLLAATGLFGVSAYVYFTVPTESKTGVTVGYVRSF